MNEIIRIENLTHTYGEGTPFRRSAVENLSLDIYRGEFLGLIGHTGSGKSTLIQHLNGLLKPTGGRVLLDGEDIWADPKKIRSVRFRVGLVFQYPEYQLFEETVYRDIAFGPTNMGLTGAELAQRLLHEEGIDDVTVERIGGNLTDHYDPSTRTLRLSQGVADSTSLTALGVAALVVLVSSVALESCTTPFWLVVPFLTEILPPLTSTLVPTVTPPLTEALASGRV